MLQFPLFNDLLETSATPRLGDLPKVMLCTVSGLSPLVLKIVSSWEVAAVAPTAKTSEVMPSVFRLHFLHVWRACRWDPLIGFSWKCSLRSVSAESSNPAFLRVGEIKRLQPYADSEPK